MQVFQHPYVVFYLHFYFILCSFNTLKEEIQVKNEKISKALNFYFHEATAEVKKLLKDPLNWKYYTELDYYKDLDALY